MVVVVVVTIVWACLFIASPAHSTKTKTQHDLPDVEHSVVVHHLPQAAGPYAKTT